MLKEDLFWVIIDFIENNITNEHLIDELVENMGYSKRYIYTIFKHYAGINIGMYIRKRKLTKAAILVKYTKKNIGNIAMDLGFCSQQSFCRAFKMQFNISPNKYRKKKEMECRGLLKRMSKEKYNYEYKIVLKKSIRLQVTTVKYKENILKEHGRRGASLKLNTIQKLAIRNIPVYIISTIQPSNNTKQLIDITSHVGVINDNPSNFHTNYGLYAEFRFYGTWFNYIEYSRNCFITLDKTIAPCPVIEKINIDKFSDYRNPICYIVMSIPILL